MVLSVHETQCTNFPITNTYFLKATNDDNAFRHSRKITVIFILLLFFTLVIFTIRAFDIFQIY